MDELIEHLIGLIESSDERYSFEFGTTNKIRVFDKESRKSFTLRIEEESKDEFNDI